MGRGPRTQAPPADATRASSMAAGLSLLQQFTYITHSVTLACVRTAQRPFGGGGYRGHGSTKRNVPRR